MAPTNRTTQLARALRRMQLAVANAQVRRALGSLRDEEPELDKANKAVADAILRILEGSKRAGEKPHG